MDWLEGYVLMGIGGFGCMKARKNLMGGWFDGIRAD